MWDLGAQGEFDGITFEDARDIWYIAVYDSERCSILEIRHGKWSGQVRVGSTQIMVELPLSIPNPEKDRIGSGWPEFFSAESS